MCPPNVSRIGPADPTPGNGGRYAEGIFGR